MMKSSASLFKEGEFKVKIKLSDESNLTTDYVFIIKLICSQKSDLKSFDDDQYFDNDGPIAYIDHIDVIGKVHIKFNSTMVPKYAISKDDLYQNKSRILEVESYLGEASRNFKNFSLIHNETVRINGTVYPILVVRLRPDEPEDPCAERLGFYWECIDYDED